MSMTALTILQFIQVLCAYSFVVLVLPAIVLRRILRGRSFSEQFLICLISGNFFIMNLVYALQLMKISHRVTLIMATVVIVAAVAIRVNNIDVRRTIEDILEKLKLVKDKAIGRKTLDVKLRAHVIKGIKILAVKLYKGVVRKPIRFLWLVLIIGAMILIYMPQFITNYGYSASDVPVHLYWINSMMDNNIFCAGVYPFGFHCVMYYINEVFAIDIYVVMRVVAFVQNIYIVMTLLAFLKVCCKNIYIPFAATFLFVASDFLTENTYKRYYEPLPQEYGMIFILPAIYFGFRFFEIRREELKARVKKKKESLLALVLFAMSFGMTFTVHFYGTIVTTFFCMAMAIGYFFLFVRKGYFLNIIVTCFISVMVAILPMGIAFATGTPLQGSIGWGLSVISGETGDEPVNDEENEEQGSDGTENEMQEESLDLQETVPGSDGEYTPVTVPEKSLTAKVKEVVVKGYHDVFKNMTEAVIKAKHKVAAYMLFIAIGVCVGLGIIFQIFRRYCYGGMLITVGLYMTMMCIMLSPKSFGVPRLMDLNRTSIYFAYSVPVLFAICADGILNFVFWFKKLEILKNIVSCIVAAAVCLWIIPNDAVRRPMNNITLETNEAVACLTNIINEEEDFTWTICSANDELQMGKEHGYHYELINFLNEQEYVGAEGEIIIPTQSVYFFIEKRPIDYSISYEGSGQLISEEGAMSLIPVSKGISMYQAKNRWILMSKMYYWAQEFRKMYPNEMKVYCETDNFVCYKIEQNMYRLYNFAIDYGFNTY